MLRMEIPASYRILAQGSLDERWSDRLGGLTVSVFATETGSVVTRLSGELMDQAALLGVLNTLFDLHLPLISVVLLGSSGDDTAGGKSGAG
jgi:hypothetical protein